MKPALDPDEFCAATSAAALMGRTVLVDGAKGPGVVVQMPAGVFVRAKLRCSREGCKRTKTFYLRCGAPGLCYVEDPNTGAFIADLRNNNFVCTGHRRGR